MTEHRHPLPPMPATVIDRVAWLSEFARRVERDVVRVVAELQHRGWPTETIRGHVRAKADGLLTDARIDVERALNIALGPEPKKDKR